MTQIFKLRKEPSISKATAERIKKHPLLGVFFEHHPTETQRFMENLEDLCQGKSKNDIALILNLLQSYVDSCQITDHFFKEVLNDLQELQKNSKEHKVRINNAIDGYTLNRTTRIINFLQIHSKNLTSHELELAQKLQKGCESIREKIKKEDPDTMPKGLLISYVMLLREIIDTFEMCNLEITYKNRELIKNIQLELNLIRQNYHKLAEVAETLQCAIEIYGPNKPEP